MRQKRSRKITVKAAIALLSVIVATSGLTSSPAEAAGPPTCAGLEATIYDGHGYDSGNTVNGYVVIKGSPEADVIRGTSNADKIEGFGRNDIICGLQGNDLIYGHGGDDTIYAGSGADIVYGGSGNDVLLGGDGSDRLYGYLGNDTLNGGNQDDSLYGHDGTDIYKGGSGSDFCDDSSKFVNALPSGCDRGEVISIPTITNNKPTVGSVTQSCSPPPREGRGSFGFQATNSSNVAISVRLQLNNSTRIAVEKTGGGWEWRYSDDIWPAAVTRTIQPGTSATIAFSGLYEGDYYFEASYAPLQESYQALSLNKKDVEIRCGDKRPPRFGHNISRTLEIEQTFPTKAEIQRSLQLFTDTASGRGSTRLVKSDAVSNVRVQDPDGFGDAILSDLSETEDANLTALVQELGQAEITNWAQRARTGLSLDASASYTEYVVLMSAIYALVGQSGPRPGSEPGLSRLDVVSLSITVADASFNGFTSKKTARIIRGASFLSAAIGGVSMIATFGDGVNNRQDAFAAISFLAGVAGIFATGPLGWFFGAVAIITGFLAVVSPGDDLRAGPNPRLQRMRAGEYLASAGQLPTSGQAGRLHSLTLARRLVFERLNGSQNGIFYTGASYSSGNTNYVVFYGNLGQIHTCSVTANFSPNEPASFACSNNGPRNAGGSTLDSQIQAITGTWPSWLDMQFGGGGGALNVPEPSETELVISETKAAGSQDGFILYHDANHAAGGTRQWINASCYTQLTNAGVSSRLVASYSNDIEPLTNVSGKNTCDQLETLLAGGGAAPAPDPTPLPSPDPAPGGSVGEMVISETKAAGTQDGFILYTDGTRQWINATCFTQLKAAGIAHRSAAWSTEIQPLTNVSGKNSCDQLETLL